MKFIKVDYLLIIQLSCISAMYWSGGFTKNHISTKCFLLGKNKKYNWICKFEYFCVISLTIVHPLHKAIPFLYCVQSKHGLEITTRFMIFKKVRCRTATLDTSELQASISGQITASFQFCVHLEQLVPVKFWAQTHTKRNALVKFHLQLLPVKHSSTF